MFVQNLTGLPQREEGKQGIWIFIFTDRESTENLPKTKDFNTWNLPPNTENFSILKVKDIYQGRVKML